MGENKHIKELDAFAKKYVKEISQEKPSLDFTASLMDKIAVQDEKSVLRTKALISKKAWFFIITAILAAILIPFKSSEKSLLNLPKVNFSFFDKIQMPSLLENMSISNTVLYAIFFFGLMIIVQVFFLKNYFDKRYQ